MKNQTIPYIFYFLLIISSTLSSSSMFINSTQLGFYLYTFITAGLLLYLLFRVFTHSARIGANRIIVIYGVYLLYLFFHISLNKNAYPDFFGGKAGIWILSFIHLLILSSFFKGKTGCADKKVHTIFSLFLLTAVFQSGYAYLQLCGLVDNMYSQFAIGGTVGNPNVLATFLSLVLVYAFNDLLRMEKKRCACGYLIILSIAIILPIVIICQCRTAWLALFVGIVAGICMRYKLISILRERITWLIFPVIAGMIIFGCYELYRLKQPSADGRLYIWKLTVQMILQKSLQGYGFNAFEKEYNLYQANYFDQLPENEKQYDRGLYAETAHNDFLENCLETGIPGMLLFLLIFAFAIGDYIRQQTDRKNRSAFCALLAWIAVSLFNYNQIIPFNMLFLSFLLADLSSNKSFPVNKTAAVIFSIFITGIAVRTVYACRAEAELKKQLSDIVKLEKTEQVDKWMPQTGSNLYACAGICMKAKNVEKADLYLRKARNISSNYSIYKASGNIAALKKDFPLAIEYYSTALNMTPLLILPRYELFKIYRKTGMKDQADEQARIIISIQPKTKNEKAERIREKMKEYGLSEKGK